MPSTSASRKQVERQRRKENNALASLPARAEIVFTEQYMNREVSQGCIQMYIYQYNGQQERFLLADSGGENRILIFGSEASGGWSQQMEHVFIDGTFSGSFFPLFSLYFLQSARLYFINFLLFFQSERASSFLFYFVCCLTKHNKPNTPLLSCQGIMTKLLSNFNFV